MPLRTVAGHPPRGRPPASPAARSPQRACKPSRQCWAPPQPHTRAHSTWVADPDSPHRGRTAGGGGAPDLRRPSQRRKAPPPGTPFRRPHGAHQRLARRGAGAGPPRPHQPHPGHTGRGTPAARPRGRAAGGGIAPDTGRPSQRWKASPCGDDPPPPPRHAAPHGAGEPRGQCWAPTLPQPRPQHAGSGPRQHARRRAAGEGEAPELRHSPQRQKAPGEALPQPPQYATAARKGTTLCGRCWDRHHPRGTQPPQGMQTKATVMGPHTRTPPPTARGWRTLAAPRRRAAGGGRAPGIGHPSQGGHPCYAGGRGGT